MLANSSKFFSVIFREEWMSSKRELEREVRIANTKNFIKRLFGIYYSYTAKVIRDPILTREGNWEYSMKLTKIHKHFLWIKIKTETWRDGK